MSAENNISALETTNRDGIANRQRRPGKGRGTTFWWIRGIPVHVRDAAEVIAKKRDMKVSDFLAEAILSHVRRLEAASDTGTGFQDNLAGALPEYLARIEALENRLLPAHAARMRSPEMKAQKLVTNLVERPWLKKSEGPVMP